MLIFPSDIYDYYRPSRCPLRVYLQHNGESQAKASPFEEIIRRFGITHQKAHLKTFPSYIDLSKESTQDRIKRTIDEVNKGTQVIYHPLFNARINIMGKDIELSGEPDFLIKKEDNYLIRDAKIARKITEKDHPEILIQLEIYGWLYEQSIGKKCDSIQVLNGRGEIISFKYSRMGQSKKIIEEIVHIKSMQEEPYSPVGWAKCGGCKFHKRCWTQAEKRKDISLVMGVDQGLAEIVNRSGIVTVDQFIETFKNRRLSEVRRPHGKNMQRVGRKSAEIMRMAQSFASGEEIIIANPEIPESQNYVMFDLEGLPPHMGENEKIYLWGFQLFGENRGEFKCGLSGFGPNGDREGWEQFLSEAKDILDKYGKIPWVHWHHYERVKIDIYIGRYGDPEGIAQGIKNNLLDLLPVVNKSIALPIPSYSLKVVEKYIGFKRTQDEYGGDWAMAKYIEAIETEDLEKRNEVMAEIILYNKEDLKATWAVLKWFKSKFK